MRNVMLICAGCLVATALIIIATIRIGDYIRGSEPAPTPTIECKMIVVGYSGMYGPPTSFYSVVGYDTETCDEMMNW